MSAVTQSEVKIGSVLGFPLGATSTRSKIAEAEAIVVDGATEVDMVINIGWVKEGNHKRVAEEIQEVRAVVGKEVVLKVILETVLLSQVEKRLAATLVVDSGGDFVKTSTGLVKGGGATLEDVSLLEEVVGGRGRIKAAGGIRNTQTAIGMIEAGADRIGTSSGVAILDSLFCETE